MKKALITLICLFAMMAAGTSLKAQEAILELYPGWTWISYPSTDTLDFATVFDSFTPMTGDYIKSQMGYAEYYEGYGWFGSLMNFMPCKGFMYKSNRTEPVMITVGTPLSQQAVTTAEPTDITAVSAVVGGTVTIGEGNHIFARGVCWGTEPLPNVDGNHTTDATVAGSQTVTLDNLSPSTTYYVRAYVATDNGLFYGEVLSFTTENGGSGDHGYVDLGLPSGLLWATCNVGANAPEEYGDYFAWGETQPKDTYNWSMYQHCMGNVYMLTRYCDSSSFGYNGFTDNLTTLLPEDDAATTNWGSVWRMPTKEEWQELYNNTTCIWTTQDGVNGQLFTASNGNSLFLPAAGCRDDHSLDGAGSFGSYWSNLLGMDYPLHAWAFSFYSGDYDVLEYSRHYGRSVRAVRPLGQNTSFFINVTANPTESGIVTGSGIYQEGQSCTVTATANEGYTFSNWTENGAVVSINATYSFTVEADRTLVANFAVPSGESHEYVDLGLPSGLLWATCNVGAYNPEDYGDYFAWGETQPKDTYNWSTYQYCMGSENTLTKYCTKSSCGYNGFTDNLTILEPSDDAATANWGSDWRMPTYEEWWELCENTTVTWTTQNGVNGRLFTASNGNSLFLPAAGYCSSSVLYSAGSNGGYWSSSLYSGRPDDAWNFYFGSDDYDMYNDYRNYGQSVRAVRVGSQN